MHQFPDIRLQASFASNQSVLSDSSRSFRQLGIVSMELWFNKTLESQSYRKQFYGADGQPNHFTDYMTALKWHETILDQAGAKRFSNAIRLCLTFGVHSINIADAEVRQSGYGDIPM